jgi:glycosyltransferase involved in cell wall biosynthesis
MPVRKRIVYIQYTNPGGYPPLEHSSRILADGGWRVLFLGAGSDGASALRFPEHANIRVRQISFCPPGFRQKLHYLFYCVWVLAWVFVWRPRWIYASDPLSCPIGLLLSYIPGLQVIYHEHDSPAGAGLPGMVMRARRALAHRARYCVLPNERRIEKFQKDVGGGANTICVWNCPRKAEIAPPRAPKIDGDVWLLYHGSIVPERLPLTVLTALAELPDRLKLRVIGYETVGSRGYLDTIRAIGRELGIAHRLEFPGTLPLRSDLLKYCAASDVGLAFMPQNETDFNMVAMVGASNKPFDYLACGLALVVSDLPDWRQTFVDAGYAVACNPGDPNCIAGVLRDLLGDPTKMRTIGEMGRRRIEREWNYESQFLFPNSDLECGQARFSP